MRAAFAREGVFERADQKGRFEQRESGLKFSYLQIPFNSPFVDTPGFHDIEFRYSERLEFADDRLAVGGLEMDSQNVQAVMLELLQLST